MCSFIKDSKTHISLVKKANVKEVVVCDRYDMRWCSFSRMEVPRSRKSTKCQIVTSTKILYPGGGATTSFNIHFFCIFALSASILNNDPSPINANYQTVKYSQSKLAGWKHTTKRRLIKGALYGLQLADIWWMIVALLHIGGHPFSAEKNPVSFRPLVMSRGRHKINMNAIQKIPWRAPLTF